MRLNRLHTLTGIGLVAALLLSVTGPLPLSTVVAANLASRQLQISESVAGSSSRYKISLSGQSAGLVGSVRLQLCIEDPFPGEPCSGPAGLSFLGAALIAQSGMTGFSIHPSTTANELILTRVPGASIPGQVVFEIASVINPSAAGTYYGRLETFASIDATGPRKDGSGLAYAILPATVSVQSVVPPYLLFCVANTIQGQDCNTAQGNYIDFGDFAPSRTASAKTQFIVATNADFGFTVVAQGTTLTSGINTIPALASPDVSRTGVSQFGLNLRANSAPSVGQEPEGMLISSAIAPSYNQPNYYMFNNGDTLVQAINPDIAKYTISYIVNVSANQAPGVYVSTFTYIANATF
ncbi:hypothetical protein IPL85_00645 [Candidatus Saccharibacteria bacterium]|nr:MAG: hypothetical protein IPL85_00645 [Candidatus Saccharibacteria bacterium]